MDAVERAFASRAKVEVFPLSSALMLLHLEWCVQCGWVMEQVQQRAAKMIRNWSMFQRGVWESQDCSPWICSGDLVRVYKFLMGGYKEGRARLFSVVYGERTGKHKLRRREFCLNTRKNCFHYVGSNIGTGCSRRFWSLTLETFKTWLDTALRNLFQLILLWKSRGSPEVPSSLSYPLVVCFNEYVIWCLRARSR